MFEEVMLLYFIGVILGAIFAWNRKVVYWIIMFSIVISIFTLLSIPGESSTYLDVQFILNTLACMLGFACGQCIYEFTFE